MLIGEEFEQGFVDGRGAAGGPADGVPDPVEVLGLEDLGESAAHGEMVFRPLIQNPVAEQRSLI